MKHIKEIKNFLSESAFIGDEDQVIGFDNFLKKVIEYQNDRYEDSYLKKSKYEIIEYIVMNPSPINRKIPNLNKLFELKFGSEIDKKYLTER